MSSVIKAIKVFLAPGTGKAGSRLFVKVSTIYVFLNSIKVISQRSVPFLLVLASSVHKRLSDSPLSAVRDNVLIH